MYLSMNDCLVFIFGFDIYVGFWFSFYMYDGFGFSISIFFLNLEEEVDGFGEMTVRITRFLGSLN